MTHTNHYLYVFVIAFYNHTKCCMQRNQIFASLGAYDIAVCNEKYLHLLCQKSSHAWAKLGRVPWPLADPGLRHAAHPHGRVPVVWGRRECLQGWWHPRDGGFAVSAEGKYAFVQIARQIDHDAAGQVRQLAPSPEQTWAVYTDAPWQLSLPLMADGTRGSREPAGEPDGDILSKQNQQGTDGIPSYLNAKAYSFRGLYAFSPKHTRH